MKIYDIWDIIEHEEIDIKKMIFSSLDGQVNVLFQQILDQEIQKLAIKCKDCPDEIINYYILLFSLESLEENCDFKVPVLKIYRELIFAVDLIKISRDDGLDGDAKEIDFEVTFNKNKKTSKASLNLLKYILDKVYQSEFIDITESTLSKLKSNRKRY